MLPIFFWLEQVLMQKQIKHLVHSNHFPLQNLQSNNSYSMQLFLVVFPYFSKEKHVKQIAAGWCFGNSVRLQCKAFMLSIYVQIDKYGQTISLS